MLQVASVDKDLFEADFTSKALGELWTGLASELADASC